MTVELLERDEYVSALDEALRQAASGYGRIVLVSGEAGIGKTALVERFVADAPAERRALWGACEALFTPRPLGPFYDIAQQMAPTIRALLDGETNRPQLFAAILDDLTRSPAILIIEDIHWADEATLDLIKYLGRRIHRTPSLLILTWRDDELGKDHPLRFVLGDLPAREVTRLRLFPLSHTAVARLAHQAHRSARQLHAITGGNPFFVTEALASDRPGVPASVSDAVLARLARRSPDARRLVEAVAIAPGQIEQEVVTAISASDDTTLDECLSTGVLRLDGGAIRFRHELARQAVEGALSLARRQALNAQVLHALLERAETSGVEKPSLARLVHHAAAAEDAALVLRFAPDAAQQASARGAHREAAAHYQTALRYANALDPARRAALLDGLANERFLTGRMEEAVAPYEAALALWRALDHTEKVGHTLRRLSRLHWFLGDNVEAERYAMQAVETLETLPPGRELAMAYGNLAHLGTRAAASADTLFWGERAIALAERLGDYETLSYALNSVGSVEIGSGDEQGRIRLEQSLAIALEHGYEEHAARAYANLAINRVVVRQFAEAEHYLQKGIAYCAERDLDPWGHFLRWAQARVRLDQGDWVAAAEEAAAVLSVPWMAVTNRISALLVLGKVQARRGDPSAEALLDEARELALATGEIHRIEQVAAARAEWRWLHGDLSGCVAEVSVTFRQPFHIVRPWYQSEVVIWLWRGGDLTTAPEGALPPYALQIAGDWRAAANAWERLDSPWEQALALLDGDEAAQRAALAIFERLGATPAMEIARRKLRQAGARGLSRGPYRVARANPQGLTNRQLEVLPLLAEGRSNAEIAGRLSTSPRTVEHHVSAVLTKLNAHSRAEAVRRAYELGLLAPTSKIGE
ncbi:MAG TPA: AAA family ATPase [Ktedonobacterales bacterium]|nr:AAA family ATPase [Ktedonobacterales bacterium]